jgi:hypothetical protein
MDNENLSQKRRNVGEWNFVDFIELLIYKNDYLYDCGFIFSILTFY